MRRLAALLLLVALALGRPVVAATGDVTLPLCDSTVHDRFTTTGPDGVTYPTWHPQIDNERNCHFDHEHGSNPALVAPVSWPYGSSLVPAYGYTASRAGMTEGHAGFKTYVFQMSGYRWMLTHHFGTANPQIAACARFHTFDLIIATFDGTIKVDIHFVGDYGKAVDVDTDTVLTPTACPNQGDIGASTGARKIPVSATGTDYEPWRLDEHELTAIGFRSGGFTINTDDPQKACNAITCDSGVVKVFQGQNNIGTRRFLTFNDPLRILGTYTGTFYTDAMGMTAVTSGTPGSVKQYVAPGFSLTVGQQPHCRQANSAGTDGMYWCSLVIPNESALQRNRFVTGPN